MSRRIERYLMAVGAGLVVVAWACSEQNATGPTTQEPPGPALGLIVSDPFLEPSGYQRAFLSAPPGSLVPSATLRISDVTSGYRMVAAVVAGGVDPVSFPASARDSLRLTVIETGEDLMATVPPRKPPTVVRTIPQRGRTDVPLNARIVVQFSEPIRQATLTAAAIKLLRGADPVAATRRVRDPDGLLVEVVPDSLLAPATGYTLVITRDLQDLDGDSLDAQVEVSFTTGQAVAGPVSSVIVSPDSPAIDMGQLVQFRADVFDAFGKAVFADVGWSTSNAVTATVTAQGLVMGRRAGVANITATGEGLSGSVSLLVTNRNAPVALIAFAPESAAVLAGDSVQLAAATLDEYGGQLFDRPVTWSSSDTVVATVTPAGRVHTRAAGLVFIRATSEARTDSALVEVGEHFASIFGGPAGNAACALTPAGKAYCWGAGTSGQLGNGRTTTTPYPVPVAGNITFASLVTSVSHTCGLTPAGVAYCWGSGFSGALGTGDSLNRLAPALVAGGLTFTMLTAGAEHTCGLTADGTAYCWGRNRNGLLGVGTAARQKTPASVAGSLRFTQIASGAYHSCGLTGSGEAYCWGNGGDFGELGTGLRDSSTVPVRAASGLTFVSLTAGARHTCGITAAGVAYCWGLDGQGQLGNGGGVVGCSCEYSAEPVMVLNVTNFARLIAGDAYTCGVTTDQNSYCWGKGPPFLNYAPSPNGDFDAPAPTPGMTFGSLAGGSVHVCGRAGDGLLYCWGYGYNGSLGNGRLGSVGAIVLTPERVRGSM